MYGSDGTLGVERATTLPARESPEWDGSVRTEALLEDTVWSHIPLTTLSYEILLVLAEGDVHGYGILQRLSDRTDGRVVPDTGTLYTAIRRLHRRDLIRAAGPPGPRGAKTYTLTALGRSVLALESRRLATLVATARRLRLIGLADE